MWQPSWNQHLNMATFFENPCFVQFFSKMVASNDWSKIFWNQPLFIKLWESNAIFEVGYTQTSSNSTYMNLFLSVISLDKCPLSNYQYNPPLPNSRQIQVWGFASQIYKTSFSKNGFKTQIYKTRFAILIREIYKAVIVQSLKFTQKVTVNHMLPFPSALYTFVTLVYNKQTNKHYVNSADHCILPFM